MPKWSEWLPFPDPRKMENLTAPFGAGCYELRNGEELILFGTSIHVAQRMTSLLPAPLGAGGRRNNGKRAYVLENIADIEYRTWAFASDQEAKLCERALKAYAGAYRFGT